MKKFFILTCLSASILAGCVSTKKYDMLQSDYQKAGEAQRSYEQEHRVLQVEIQDMRQKIARLEAENNTLDSLNHILHHRIVFESAESAWKEKYEVLEKAYNAIKSPEKMRGEELPLPTPKTEIVQPKFNRTPPPVVTREKGYSNFKNAKEVKIPETPTKELAETVNPSKEIITATGNVHYLHIKIGKIFDEYKVGDKASQKKQEKQIELSLSDELLFEGEAQNKFSSRGEEILHRLVFTFAQYPNIEIDLTSQGSQSAEKTDKIKQMFNQFNIQVKVANKDSLPIAFETSGTQKANNMLTVKVN